MVSNELHIVQFVLIRDRDVSAPFYQVYRLDSSKLRTIGRYKIWLSIPEEVTISPHLIQL